MAVEWWSTIVEEGKKTARQNSAFVHGVVHSGEDRPWQGGKGKLAVDSPHIMSLIFLVKKGQYLDGDIWSMFPVCHPNINQILPPSKMLQEGLHN
jgi:hypothetical protein